MSLFKFHDSNFLEGYNRPDILATVDTFNGNQFKVVADQAVPFATDVEAETGDIYVMNNIIDKPEILNTDAYKVGAGEYIRGFRLKDFAGQKLDMSADLIVDAFAGVVAGDKLVPRVTADTTSIPKWKKVADVSAYQTYLQVVKKTTFGAFTVDAAGGTVAGGYLAEIKVVDIAHVGA